MAAAHSLSASSPDRSEVVSFAQADAETAEREIPTTQKAWRVTRKGTPSEVLNLTVAPNPTTLKKGEVYIKVQAAALNPAGYKTMGALPRFLLRRLIGVDLDLAGTIIDGNGTVFKEGDEVFGWILLAHYIRSGQGALAQYARLPAAGFTLRPKNTTPTQAAGFGVAGQTAYHALLGLAALEAGQSVFVNGGSTAVGAFAIQIAKAKGARVSASASARNEQYVRGLGADEFFDYTKAPLHEQLVAADVTPKYNVFLEAVGILDPALFIHSPAYLAPDGVFLSVGPQGSDIGTIASFAWNVLLRPSFLGGVRRKWKLVTITPVPADLEGFAALVENGKIRPLVDSVYAFEDVLKAYERVMTKRARGKVVVKVDPTAE